MPSNNNRTETTPLLTITTNPRPNLPPRSNTLTTKMFWTLACLYGASAVGLGAFGAHGLKKAIGTSDPARLANFATAAHYQMVHSAALLFAAQAGNPVPCTLLTAGMTLFSGSLYALVLDPARFRFLGPVTPLGGLCLIGGWLSLAWK
ncbi:DUF423-domain-containing protein [Hypoxylon fragiforme]|uniref:DUF423-domain-containing protein n=1 Tax=Hypoxylon fragiforme TaxID=63214 RepID=UPI0020C64EA1|nr:DUF423-domain-containing protein [Hypoxylon fragiforme]KAI2603866.1 DUF423-domain-containing protein [Hypoxylon fragiforme]